MSFCGMDAMEFSFPGLGYTIAHFVLFAGIRRARDASSSFKPFALATLVGLKHYFDTKEHGCWAY